MTHKILTASSFGHLVGAPVERVDVADWLAHLTSSEYRRCGPNAHVAAGVGAAEDGGRLWLQAETIGEVVLVHQYAGELVGARRCRLASISDVFTDLGRTTMHVVWDFSVEPFDEHSCEYVSDLAAIATDEFLAFIDDHGLDFEATAAAYSEAVEEHNALETASFAKSIERRALASGAS